MYKDLDYIQLVFENCEIARVDKKYLHNIFTSEIKTKKIFANSNTLVFDMLTCDYMYISFKKEFNHLFHKDVSFMTSYFVKDRIQNHNDITSICFYYKDKTYDQIYMPWGESILFYYTNFNQKFREEERGAYTLTFDRKHFNFKIYLKKLFLLIKCKLSRTN